MGVSGSMITAALADVGILRQHLKDLLETPVLGCNLEKGMLVF